MTNSELLRMAAYAARIRLSWDVSGRVCWLESSRRAWNPLTDDGDALRLAVTLHLDLCIAPNTALCAWNEIAHDWIEESPGDDPCAAMRRAIVRTAAEIGKTRSD